jgi:FkbM family methyltransferase
MINYDFVEVGTSDFDTLIELADDNVLGISIEPIQEYLDNLPNKQNVIKVNAAISIDGTSNDTHIYYIPPKIIEENGYHLWMRGCNKIGEYHPRQINHPNIKNDLTKFVKCIDVKQITISQLYEKYNIHHIKYLKIDTEGYDCNILQYWLEYLKTKDSSFYPSKIMFETNTLTPKEYVMQTIEDYINIGYSVESFTYDAANGSTVLIYE